MNAVNPKKDRKYRNNAKDNFWSKVEEIPDEEIKEAVKAGKKVRVIEDSTNSIEVPEYPSDSEY